MFLSSVTLTIVWTTWALDDKISISSINFHTDHAKFVSKEFEHTFNAEERGEIKKWSEWGEILFLNVVLVAVFSFPTGGFFTWRHHRHVSARKQNISH